MNKQILIWQVMVFVLTLFLFLTLRKYWFDQNEIKARNYRANCMVEMKKAFPNEQNFTICNDILKPVQ